MTAATPTSCSSPGRRGRARDLRGRPELGPRARSRSWASANGARLAGRRPVPQARRGAVPPARPGRRARRSLHPGHPRRARDHGAAAARRDAEDRRRRGRASDAERRRRRRHGPRPSLTEGWLRPTAGSGARALAPDEPSPSHRGPHRRRSRSATSTPISRASPQALGGSFARYGFAVISDHGLPQDRIDAAHRRGQGLLRPAGGDQARDTSCRCGGQRGYTPFGIETAKGADPLRPQGILARRPRPAARPSVPRHMADNVWPDAEVAGFHETVGWLYQRARRHGPQGAGGHRRATWASTAISSTPTVDVGQLDPAPAALSAGARRTGRTSAPARTRTSTSSPCCSAPRRPGWRCWTATAAGCRSTRRPARWSCNIGDMLQRLTNHVLPSTTHRVVNPAPERRGFPRYSTPFFLHFNPDYLIRTLPGCDRRRPSRPLPDADHRRRLPPGAPAGDQADLVEEPVVLGREGGRQDVVHGGHQHRGAGP